MKTLKIAFLLLAVVLLTVSGQSSETAETIVDTETYKQDHTKYDLLALNKKKLAKPNNN